MEALQVDETPVGPEWQYEPKWDGFRCLVFRDGADVKLQSKSGRPLTRYFPELVEAIRKLKSRTFILDGEIVVRANGSFSFDALLQRIHPAESRIRTLSVETPAMLIVFDLLVGADNRSLVDHPLSERRQKSSARHDAHPPVAGDDQSHQNEKLARTFWNNAVSLRRSQWHAKNQELS
jgi:ATP-dependent DNA ligase